MVNWRTAIIDEVCNVEYGTRVVQKRDGGSIFPVYGGGGATFFMDTTNRANRVVVSRFGMSEACTRYVDGEFFLNDSGLTLSPKDAGILLPTFLDQCTLALNEKIFALGKGAAQKNLDVPAFRGLCINFPVSLVEQERVVALLDEAFDGIAVAKANAEKNLRNARAIFESNLQSVFAARGLGWVEKTLKQVSTEFGRGKSKHRPRGDTRILGGEYPLIQTGDVANSDHLIVEYSQTYNEAGLAQSKLWPRGTVCIAIVGANVAETAILDFDSCFPDSVIGIVVNDELADNEYVEFLLQTFKAILKERGKGTARDNINLGTFESQKFPFPGVAEQKRIVVRMNELALEIHRLEAIYQQKLTTLDELKKSLLHRAFNGDL